jgi:hypothetical protein
MHPSSGFFSIAVIAVGVPFSIWGIKPNGVQEPIGGVQGAIGRLLLVYPHSQSPKKTKGVVFKVLMEEVVSPCGVLVGRATLNPWVVGSAICESINMPTVANPCIGCQPIRCILHKLYIVSQWALFSAILWGVHKVFYAMAQGGAAGGGAGR